MKSAVKAFALICILSSGYSAFACAGFGLTKEDTVAILNQADATIRSDKSMKGLEVSNIVYSKLDLQSGSEGDCNAQGLDATVLVMALDKKAKETCSYDGKVRLFNSVMGNFAEVELTKGFFCFPAK
jgi:hypothetical protein